MTIFDLFEDERPIDQKLLSQLVKRCSPYWVGSVEIIKKACNDNADIKNLTEIVRQEYCPYGYAGGTRWAEANEMEEFLFRPQNIRVWYKDSRGLRQEVEYSWKDFASYINYLVEKGEYYEN